MNCNLTDEQRSGWAARCRSMNCEPCRDFYAPRMEGGYTTEDETINVKLGEIVPIGTLFSMGNTMVYVTTSDFKMLPINVKGVVAKTACEVILMDLDQEIAKLKLRGTNE